MTNFLQPNVYNVSMNIIYLDTLFFINCITDYFALLCSAKLCGAALRRPFFAAASSLGGFYACLCVLPEMVWLTHPAVKAACGGLLCLIAFGQESAFFRCSIAFFFVSAALGGLFSALSLNYNNIVYIPMDFKTLLLVFVLSYFLLTTLFHHLPQTQQREFHEVTITFNRHQITCTALRDTGNELFDPISNRPVLICESSVLFPLFPNIAEQLFSSDPLSFYQSVSEIPRYAGKMKLIPFQSVGGHGFLVGFKPDLLRIDGIETELIVAMSQQAFNHNHTYQAIY